MVGVWDNDGLYGTQERKPWEENRLHGRAHSGGFRHTQLWPVPAGLMSKLCMWFSHCKNPWALERHLRWVSAPLQAVCWGGVSLEPKHLALPFAGCVNLTKLLNLAECSFSCVSHTYNSRVLCAFFKGIVHRFQVCNRWGEMAPNAAQGLVESSCSVSVHRWASRSKARGREEEFHAWSATVCAGGTCKDCHIRTRHGAVFIGEISQRGELWSINRQNVAGRYFCAEKDSILKGIALKKSRNLKPREAWAREYGWGPCHKVGECEQGTWGAGRPRTEWAVVGHAHSGGVYQREAQGSIHILETW